MKKYILILILVISCKEASKDYALVSGKITNHNNQVQDIYIWDTENNTMMDTIAISKEGTFRDTLKLKEGLYSLYVESYEPVSIYLSNGNELQVEYDAKSPGKVLSISGIGSEISSYLLEKQKIERHFIGKTSASSFFIEPTTVETFSLQEDAFKARLNRLKDSLLGLIHSLKGINEAYKTMEERNLHYEYIYSLSWYKSTHASFTEKENFEVSNSFLKELDDLNNTNYANEEDYSFSKSYRSLAFSYYNRLIESRSVDNIDYLKKAAQIDVEFIKNTLLALKTLSIMSNSNYKELYNIFIANSTNEKDRALVTEIYNKLKTLDKGSPSPKFVDYENHKGGTSSLDDFKGKYVYVDLWATWCGPCIAEIPFLQSIEKKYHDKNIEFVSISVDKVKDHDKWKAMVSKKELQGVQLIAGGDNEFTDAYNVSGIPRFILIDPEGNIVNADAPRPSLEKEITQLFDEIKI